jgi:hypothetical protein
MNRFDEAIRRIETYGWIKKTYGDYDLGFCMLGAMGGRATGLTAREQAAIGQAARQLDITTSELVRGAAGAVIRYNDHPQTSQEDVLLLLKTASEIYEPAREVVRWMRSRR